MNAAQYGVKCGTLAQPRMAGLLLGHGGLVFFLSIASSLLICEGELGDSNLSTVGSSILDEILKQTLPTDAGLAVIELDPLSSERTRLPQDFNLNQTHSQTNTLNQTEFNATMNEADDTINDVISGNNERRAVDYNQLYTDEHSYNISPSLPSTPNVFDVESTAASVPSGDVGPAPSNAPNGSDSARQKLPKVYIGGLFELNDTAAATNGRSELDAALLAVEHINQREFIPGYHLEMVYNDTKCDPGQGADAFYDFVYRKPTMLMLIGSSCSDVTEMLGEIVRYWNLVLVSYGATSPALSKRELYPTFFRLASTDRAHNAARKTFIQHFQWDTAATLVQDQEEFTLAINEMNTELERVNITLISTETFRMDSEDDLHTKMLALKESGARVIIGSFKEEAARQVFCEAYHLGLYGPSYMWMLVGWYQDRWWQSGTSTRCTHAQLSKAIEGYFSVDSLNSIIGNKRSISGLTTEDFLDEYDRRRLSTPRSAYAQVAYDTVWTVALTLKRTVETWSRKKFHYATGKPLEEIFFKTMGHLDFMGVSGPVSFDGPDRRGITVFKQNQDAVEVRVALFYPENSTLDFNCHGCQAIIWKGGKVPADKYTILYRRVHINSAAFYSVCAASVFGICLALFFLAFNLYHRKLKYIKLSSPILNDVAIVGCILVYIAVMLHGFDDSTMHAKYFPVICTARAFLLAAGFSLAFGAMFTKTYRVHQIFTRAHSGLVRSRLLKDKQLLLIIGALLVLDSIILSLWLVIDPLKRSVQNFSAVPSENDRDLLFIPQLSKCDSKHLDKWMGVFYAYKGILVLFGVYMAWETRNVKIPVLNDSQYIGMNIYNVVLMSITVVVLSNLLSDRPTLSFTVISALMLLSTTGLLLLLFLPKIYGILKHNGSPVITTYGLTVEANTRRFATDDKKERYYRAEVQNRVYKREMLQLEQEIHRLERLLQRPLNPYPPVDDDLLYLLPESKLDATPQSVRRRRAELARFESITDANEMCMDLQEMTSPASLMEMRRQLEHQDSGFHTMSFKNSNYMSAEEEGAPCSNEPSEQCAKPEVEPLLSPGSEGSDKDVSSRLAAKRGALRRQGNQDGDKNERQSLLVDDHEGDEEVFLCDPQNASTILENPNSSLNQSPSSSMTLSRPDELELQDLTPGGASGGAAVPSVSPLSRRHALRRHSFSGDYSIGKHANRHRKLSQLTEPVKRKRIQVLQKQLSKIRTELESLGEIEVEVSYV